VETDGNGFSNMSLHPDMTIDRTGRWKILYYCPKTHFVLRIAGLTPIEELEANLNAVLTWSAPALDQEDHLNSRSAEAQHGN
jgi:hypothetical protein